MIEISNVWVSCYKPNPQAKLRLFCFPYAGGSGSIFRPWLNYLPSTIELCSIELPGRGKRIANPPFIRLKPLIESLTSVILPNLDKPFAFFGHSMGGIVSFELTRILAREYGIYPVSLLISGCRAPQVPASTPPIHQLPDSDFLEELRRFNGTPQAVLENAELIELMLPTLRADFAVLETYKYVFEPPLNCPIAVFGGLEDKEVSYKDLSAWRSQTGKAFSLLMFEGDHFFIDSVRSLFLASLLQNLYLSSPFPLSNPPNPP